MEPPTEEKQPKPELAELNTEALEIAYTVISHYVDHAQISGLVIAQLAARLGEEGVKPIAQGEYWQGYMASRRILADAKENIERLTRLLERLQQKRVADE